jgi:hypothetical protein
MTTMPMHLLDTDRMSVLERQSSEARRHELDSLYLKALVL